jgi:hypothetical protein
MPRIPITGFEIRRSTEQVAMTMLSGISGSIQMVIDKTPEVIKWKGCLGGISLPKWQTASFRGSESRSSG